MNAFLLNLTYKFSEKQHVEFNYGGSIKLCHNTKLNLAEALIILKLYMHIKVNRFKPFMKDTMIS